MAIDNSADLIDSREIIERIATLSLLRQPGPVDLGNEEDNETDQDTLFAELAALEALADDVKAYAPDWKHGVTLIRDTYFEDYARDLAEDIHGKALSEASWPFDYIDWEAATDALKMDYTSVEFDETTYWVRS